MITMGDQLDWLTDWELGNRNLIQDNVNVKNVRREHRKDWYEYDQAPICMNGTQLSLGRAMRELPWWDLALHP
jgi:hypothetical protein